MTKRCYQTIRTNCYLYGIKRESTFKNISVSKSGAKSSLDERPLEDISDVTELSRMGKGVAEVINDIEILENHNIYNNCRRKYQQD